MSAPSRLRPGVASTAPGRQRFSDDQLLDAALAMFLERGYRDTQMSALALSSGTTKQTLYQRMGDKEGLYLRVLERECDLLVATLRVAYAEAATLSASGAIAHSVHAFFDVAEQRGAGLDLLLRNGAGGPRHDLDQRVIAVLVSSVTDLIDETVAAAGLEIADSTLCAAAIVGMTRQVCEEALRQQRPLEGAAQLVIGYVTAVLNRAVSAPA